MKYRIDAKYCWYNKGTQLVLLYFINGVPFTFDELPEESLYDLDLIQVDILFQNKKSLIKKPI